MRYVILIWAYTLLSAVSSFAQPVSNKDVEAIYKRQADFLLKYSEGEGAMPVKLKASYDHKERTYDVKLVTTDGDQDLLQMYDPLSYEYFYAAFYDSLKKKTPHIKPISQMATQSVFTWLYTLSAGNEDDIVNAGTLWLKNCAMIFGSDKENKGYEKVIPRERFLDSICDRLGSKQRALAAARKEVQVFFEERLKQDIDTAVSADNYQKAKTMVEIAQSTVNAEKSRKNKSQDVINSLNSQYGFDSAATYEHLLAVYRSKTNVKIDSTQEFERQKDEAVRQGDSSKISAAQNVLEKYVRLIDTIRTLEKIILESDRAKEADGAITKANGELDAAKERMRAKKDVYDSVKSAFQSKKSVYEKYLSILNNINADAYDSNSFWRDIHIKKIAAVSPSDSERIRIYFKERSSLKAIEAQLEKNNVYVINSVSLQFERGYLERIQVWVSNGYRSDIYENIYAIGMSSINNLKAFNTMRLFIRKSSTASGSGYYIKLSDVVGNYDNFLALFTRDYSPGDTEINNINPMSNPCLILRKERLINLFDSKIYTDFAGLKAGSPNGLVQIDACRRFNVNNYRMQVPGRRSDFGFFDNITVFGAITKIEQEEKRLPLRNSNVVLNNKIISPSYATTLDLRQYENASLGTDMNVALFDYPDGKFTMFFNVGLRYAHTPLEDSARTVTNNIVDTPGLATNLDAHSFTWQPKLSMEFFAERRVGLVLTYQYNIARFYTNNEFKPIVSYAKSDPNARATERNARYYHMYELFLRVETSRANNGRMFLRARYFKQQGDANTFFPQVQLGYAYNLVFRK